MNTGTFLVVAITAGSLAEHYRRRITSSRISGRI